MSTTTDIRAMDQKIRELRLKAEELRQLGHGIEAVRRNVNRILALTALLEINVSDVAEVLPYYPGRARVKKTGAEPTL